MTRTIRSRIEALERAAGTEEQTVIYMNWDTDPGPVPEGVTRVTLTWGDDLVIDRASYERELARLAVEAAEDDQDNTGQN